ncbi:MAG TPA: hypothetical protein VGD69_04405 [Herpetosiphonaceae bacterium]
MSPKALRTVIGKLLLLIALIAIAGIGSTASASSSHASSGGKRQGGTADQAIASPSINIADAHVWTREEMLSAIPYPVEKVARPSKPGAPAPSANGPQLKIEGSAPKIDQSGIKAGNPLVSSSDASVNYAAGILDPSVYTHFPHSTIGKVFFTSNGLNYVCSASVLGNNAVWTAGHCVFDPSTYTWHTNWTFVPAYADGYAPYGQWYARELWSLNGWINGGNLGYDIGSAVLWPNGNSVAYYTGSLGMVANGPRGLFISAFGYPAAYPFNGQRMAWCQDYTWVDNNQNPATNGMGCNMTGGSSGGPWIYGYTYNSVSGNYINGVNSYKYNADPNSMYSPYFGDGAINIYYGVINR